MLCSTETAIESNAYKEKKKLNHNKLHIANEVAQSSPLKSQLRKRKLSLY